MCEYRRSQPGGRGNPDRPLVCLDETSKQLIVETRTPMPAKPGRAARRDYEYERNGVANLFMMFAPLEGWRRVKATDRHAAADYGQMLKELSDVHFASAEKIVLVQDNLSTHTAASLCDLSRRRSAPPRQAVRMALHAQARKLARHGRIRTRRSVKPMSEPPHSRQARLSEAEVAAWQDYRNKHHAKADWHFTTADARVKLKRPYPHFEWPSLQRRRRNRR